MKVFALILTLCLIESAAFAASGSARGVCLSDLDNCHSSIAARAEKSCQDNAERDCRRSGGRLRGDAACSTYCQTTSGIPGSATAEIITCTANSAAVCTPRF